MNESKDLADQIRALADDIDNCYREDWEPLSEHRETWPTKLREIAAALEKECASLNDKLAVCAGELKWEGEVSSALAKERDDARARVEQLGDMLATTIAEATTLREAVEATVRETQGRSCAHDGGPCVIEMNRKALKKTD